MLTADQYLSWRPALQFTAVRLSNRWGSDEVHGLRMPCKSRITNSNTTRPPRRPRVPDLPHRSQTGQYQSRPWLTMMIDAFSRRILSFFVTYDPPGYRSCMMALREAVRRHERFPQSADLGAEPEPVLSFHS